MIKFYNKKIINKSTIPFYIVIITMLFLFILISINENILVERVQNKNPAIINSSIYFDEFNNGSPIDIIKNHNDIIINSSGNLKNSQNFLFTYDDRIEFENISLISEISYLSFDIWSELTVLPFNKNNYLFYNIENYNLNNTNIKLSREDRNLTIINNFEAIYKRPKINFQGDTYAINNEQKSLIYIYMPIGDLTVDNFKSLEIKNSLYSPSFSVYYEFYLRDDIHDSIENLNEYRNVFGNVNFNIKKQIIKDFPSSEYYIESSLLQYIEEIEQIYFTNNSDIIFAFIILILILEINSLAMLNNNILNLKPKYMMFRYRGYKHKTLFLKLWSNLILIPLSTNILVLITSYYILFTKIVFLYFSKLVLYWSLIYLSIGSLILYSSTKRFYFEDIQQNPSRSIFWKKVVVLPIFYYIYKIFTIKELGKYSLVQHPQYIGRLTPDTGILVEILYIGFLLSSSLITGFIFKELKNRSLLRKLPIFHLRKRAYFIAFITVIIFINSFFTTSILSRNYQDEYIFGESEIYADFAIKINSVPEEVNITSIYQIGNIQKLLIVDQMTVTIIDPMTNMHNSLFIVNHKKYLDFISLFNISRDENFLEYGLWTNKLLYQHLKNTQDDLNIVNGNQSAYIQKNQIYSLDENSGIIPPFFVEQLEKVIISEKYFNSIFKYNFYSNYQSTYVYIKLYDAMVDKDILSTRISKIINSDVELINNENSFENSNIPNTDNNTNFIIILNLLFGSLVGLLIWISYYKDINFEKELKILWNYGKYKAIKDINKFNNIFFATLYLVVYQSAIIFTIYRSQGINLFLYNNYRIPVALKIGIQMRYGLLPVISLIFIQTISNKFLYKRINREYFENW